MPGIKVTQLGMSAAANKSGMETKYAIVATQSDVIPMSQHSIEP
jgi:hypothetical protein